MTQCPLARILCFWCSLFCHICRGAWNWSSCWLEYYQTDLSKNWESTDRTEQNKMDTQIRTLGMRHNLRRRKKKEKKLADSGLANTLSGFVISTLTVRELSWNIFVRAYLSCIWANHRRRPPPPSRPLIIIIITTIIIALHHPREKGHWNLTHHHRQVLPVPAHVLTVW